MIPATPTLTPIRRKAFLLGAFDRFNYGDLLFPVVACKEFAAHSPQTETVVNALVDSDLTSYGAFRTRSVKAIYQPGVLSPGDAVIFAGGGTIGVDWTYMYANLLGRSGNHVLYYLRRLFGEKVVNALVRRRFGARAPFPWVAGPEDFPVPVKVAYNAVGGSEFSRLAPAIQEQTLARLAKAAYLSVRDAETERLFAPLQDRVAVELAPDSAVLMSEQFPVEWLRGRASATLREMLDGGSYLCFQANLSYARRHADRIVAVLESIYARHGLRALLLPIGRYVGLDDQIALRALRDRIRTPVEIVSDEASIFEIMLTIAGANLFLGTSLHGNITSQSFAVPHLGLSDQASKVDFYLATWDLPGQSDCVRPEDLPARVDEILAIPESARHEKRCQLIALSHANFRKLAQACELDWKFSRAAEPSLLSSR